MIVDFVISGRFIRIFLLWKLWNLPANKAKRGDFDCESSLSGLALSHALVSSFLRLIYSCKRNYVLNTTFILWNSSFFGLSVFGGSCF